MSNSVPVTFVNAVDVNGFLNGVVNLALSTYQFLPVVKDGKTVVEPTPILSANLRMDLFCAQQLRDQLDSILKAQTKPAPEQVN